MCLLRRNSKEASRNATRMAAVSSQLMRSRTCSSKLMASLPWKKRSKVGHFTHYLVFMEEFDTNQDGRVSWEEFV